MYLANYLPRRQIVQLCVLGIFFENVTQTYSDWNKPWDTTKKNLKFYLWTRWGKNNATALDYNNIAIVSCLRCGQFANARTSYYNLIIYYYCYRKTNRMINYTLTYKSAVHFFMNSLHARGALMWYFSVFEWSYKF